MPTVKRKAVSVFSNRQTKIQVYINGQNKLTMYILHHFPSITNYSFKEKTKNAFLSNSVKQY